MLFADADARRTIAAVRGRDLVWRQGCWEGEPPSARAGRLGARKGRVEVSWTQRGMKRQSALRAHREGIPTPLVCRWVVVGALPCGRAHFHWQAARLNCSMHGSMEGGTIPCNPTKEGGAIPCNPASPAAHGRSVCGRWRTRARRPVCTRTAQGHVMQRRPRELASSLQLGAQLRTRGAAVLGVTDSESLCVGITVPGLIHIPGARVLAPP